MSIFERHVSTKFIAVLTAKAVAIAAGGRVLIVQLPIKLSCFDFKSGAE